MNNIDRINTPLSDEGERGAFASHPASKAEPTRAALPSDASGISLRPVFFAIAIVGVVEVLVATLWFGPLAAGSVAYGAALGGINLAFLGRMVRVFLSQDGASLPWFIGALVKLAVLVLAMYLPLRANLLDLLPFMCGFGALPIGIVCGQFSVPPTRKAN